MYGLVHCDTTADKGAVCRFEGGTLVPAEEVEAEGPAATDSGANIVQHAIWQLLEMFYLQQDVNEGYLPEVGAGPGPQLLTLARAASIAASTCAACPDVFSRCDAPYQTRRRPLCTSLMIA
jgi:hypothetical protein